MSSITQRNHTRGTNGEVRNFSLATSRAEVIVLIEQFREEMLKQKWIGKNGTFGLDTLVKLCSMKREEVHHDHPTESSEDLHKEKLTTINIVQDSTFNTNLPPTSPTQKLSIYRKFKPGHTKTSEYEADYMGRLMSFYKSKQPTAPTLRPTLEHLCSLSKRDMTENSGLTKNGNFVFKRNQDAREALLEDAFSNGYKSMMKELKSRKKSSPVKPPSTNIYGYNLSSVSKTVKPPGYKGHKYIALPSDLKNRCEVDLKKSEQNIPVGISTLSKTTRREYDCRIKIAQPMKSYMNDSGVMDCSFDNDSVKTGGQLKLNTSFFDPLVALNGSKSQITVASDVAVGKNQQKEFQSICNEDDGAADCQAAIDAYLLLDSEEEFPDENLNKSANSETFKLSSYNSSSPSSFTQISRFQANFLLSKLKQFGMIEEMGKSNLYKFRSDMAMEEDLYFRVVVMGYRLYQRASDASSTMYEKSRRNCRKVIRGKEILKFLSTQEESLIEALKIADYMLKYQIIKDINALENRSRCLFYGDRKHFYAFNMDFNQLKNAITMARFLSDDFSFYKVNKSPDSYFTPKYEEFLNEDGSMTWAALLHPNAPYRVISRKVKTDFIGYGMTIRGNSPCFVSNVDPDGPACGYGIKIGQYILEINKKLTMGCSSSSLEEIAWNSKDWIEFTVMEKIEEVNGNKVMKGEDMEYQIWFKKNFGCFPIWNEDKTVRIIDPEECEKALLRNHSLMKKSNQIFFHDYQWKHRTLQH